MSTLAQSQSDVNIAQPQNETPMERSNMQIAVYTNVSKVLTMPTNEFIEYHMQPIEDDSWIRHEEIVHIEDLTENERGQTIKKSILQDYRCVIEQNGGARMDPILEGMLYYESFMDDYRSSSYKNDSNKAHCYRTSLVEQFRKKHTAPTEVDVNANTQDDCVNELAEEQNEDEEQAEHEEQNDEQNA